jgi:hypothetical protein
MRNVQFGTAADPHTGLVSSPAQFLLMPTIADASPLLAAVGTPLTVNVTPAVGRTQRATLYIGDYAVELGPRPATDPDASTSLRFDIPATFPHTQPATAAPLRLQVDRVQSKLTPDNQPASPTFGQFLPQAKVSGP